MNLSEGQQLALTQLQSIEVESNYDFEIIGYQECSSNGQFLEILLSVNIRSFEKTQAGFQFRPRERIIILVHKDFPFELPKVSFIDFRYIGKPHVQWGKDICLYQSIESDYDPSDGMFGFLQRLHQWLKKASLGELDPVDAPLHPPVAYTFRDNIPNIIPNSNTPAFEGNYWIGACVLGELNETSYIITEWINTQNVNKGLYYGAVLLMKNEMPFEYPFTLSQLIFELRKNGVDINSFLQNLGDVSLANGKGTSLIIVIGTAMRGIGPEKKQHLAAWYLEEKYARSIRTIFGTKINSSRALSITKKHAERLDIFSKNSILDWCKILENREEVVISRDAQSTVSVFKCKRVAIWGCGALGSHMAEIVARTKVQELILFDNGIVKPGILSRQLFYEKEIGENKAMVLKERLLKIYSKLFPLKVEAYSGNILNLLDLNGLLKNVDLVIDTTASQRIYKKADKLLIEKTITAPVFSLVINKDAKRAMGVFKPKDYNSGLFDIIRKAKLELCEMNKNEWLEAFFPKSDELSLPFQPEPGCSDPTYIGSEADLSSLSGFMLNIASKDFFKTEEAKVYFGSPEIKMNQSSVFHLQSYQPYDNELILVDNLNQYKIYLTKDVLDKIKNEISKSDKKHHPAHETGGLLFGEWDDLSKTVYINEVSGPPSDSKSAPSHFDCGVKGTKELNDKLKKRYRGSVYFVGLWHSHPFGSNMYSGEDKTSMHLVVTELSPPKSLLLIVAYNEDNYSLGGFVFNKSQFAIK